MAKAHGSAAWRSLANHTPFQNPNLASYAMPQHNELSENV